MATGSGTLADLANGAYDKVKQLGNAFETAISNTLGTGENSSYKFEYDAFPEDLGSSYYGHFMTMTAMVGDGLAQVPTANKGTIYEKVVNPQSLTPNRSVYSVAM